jgi:hypothetical protein
LFHDSGDRWNQIYDSETKKLNTFSFLQLRKKRALTRLPSARLPCIR